MNKIVAKSLIFCALAIVSSLQGCAPRGESQDLTVLLNDARDRYRSAESKIGDSPVKTQLAALYEKLNNIEKVQDPTVIKPATMEIKNELSALLVHAGYPVRPSFTEIVNQYQALANGSAVTTDSALPGSPEIRLLLVRTYSVLATELETTKFTL